MVIKKYGGNALASSQQISSLAKSISLEYQKTQEPTIIVVSAMGETTDSLLKMGVDIYKNPPAREMDMLISAGERISMALMAIALGSHGVSAISFTGSQAGILTSSEHGDAHIRDIRPIRIDKALSEKKVVVVAGFQGVDPENKEVTTLGRGGTDTTAVALAIHYKAPHCYLYKDVDGILKYPPQDVPSSPLISRISYDQMISMSYWGSQVIHTQAVELAKRHKIKIGVGSWKTHNIGTWIGER